jgi:hypothetical protein
MEVKSILSEKGKQLLVVNNFKFCMARKLNNGEIRWRCVNKKSNCLAKVYYTFGFEPMNVISSDLIHNHPEEENIKRQALSHGAKIKALDNLTEKPAKLLRQELRQSGFFDQIFTYDVDRQRKNLWQARSFVQLPPPKTQLEANM